MERVRCGGEFDRSLSPAGAWSMEKKKWKIRKV